MRKLCFVLIVLGIVSQSEAGIYPKSVLESSRFLELGVGVYNWDDGDSRSIDIEYSSLWSSEFTSRFGLGFSIDFEEPDFYSEYKKTVSDSTMNPTLTGYLDLSDDLPLAESGLYWDYSFDLSYDFFSSDLEIPSSGQMLELRDHSIGAGFLSDLNFPINFPDNSISIAPYIGFYMFFVQSYGSITNVDLDESVSASESDFSVNLNWGVQVRILDLFYASIRRNHPLNNDSASGVGFSIFKPFIF